MKRLKTIAKGLLKAFFILITILLVIIVLLFLYAEIYSWVMNNRAERYREEALATFEQFDEIANLHEIAGNNDIEVECGSTDIRRLYYIPDYSSQVCEALTDALDDNEVLGVPSARYKNCEQNLQSYSGRQAYDVPVEDSDSYWEETSGDLTDYKASIHLRFIDTKLQHLQSIIDEELHQPSRFSDPERPQHRYYVPESHFKALSQKFTKGYLLSVNFFFVPDVDHRASKTGDDGYPAAGPGGCSVTYYDFIDFQPFEPQ